MNHESKPNKNTGEACIHNFQCQQAFMHSLLYKRTCIYAFSIIQANMHLCIYNYIGRACIHAFKPHKNTGRAYIHALEPHYYVGRTSTHAFKPASYT